GPVIKRPKPMIKLLAVSVFIERSFGATSWSDVLQRTPSCSGLKGEQGQCHWLASWTNGLIYRRDAGALNLLALDMVPTLRRIVFEQTRQMLAPQRAPFSIE